MFRKGLTLIDVVALTVIIVLAATILIASLFFTSESAKRKTCAANLKGIGTAFATSEGSGQELFTVPFQSGERTDGTGAVQYIGVIGRARAVPTTTQSTAVSVTRGFWLLVRDGACAPAQFVCPSTNDAPNAESQPSLYHDVGIGADCPPNVAWRQISYGMQVPFGRFGRPSTDRGPRMPLIADKGPFGAALDGGLGPTPSTSGLSLTSPPEAWRPLNSPNHGGFGQGRGQNVMFADFHVEWVWRPIEGIDNDNIYTRWPASPNSASAPADRPTPDQMIQGCGPTSTEDRLTPYSDTDSLIYP